mgnify:CR=1 FL=1
MFFVVKNQEDYYALLDTLGEKQEYLRPWLPTGKEYTGFTLERPLCAAYIEDAIYELLAANGSVRHVVLMCPAVNAIDLSALESLESLNQRLDDLGLRFHLS